MAAMSGKNNLPCWNDENIWTRSVYQTLQEGEGYKRVTSMTLVFEVVLSNAKLTQKRVCEGTFKTTYE